VPTARAVLLAAGTIEALKTPACDGRTPWSMTADTCAAAVRLMPGEACCPPAGGSCALLQSRHSRRPTSPNPPKRIAESQVRGLLILMVVD
jgi:hypothetical protein